MKKIFFSFVILIGVLAVSCKKENAVSPQGAVVGSQTINVEYRVISESGNVEVNYLKPDSQGEFELENETVHRTYYTINFEAKKGNQFMIEAFNVVAARKTVHVQIYIDGKLFKEAFSYDPSQKAIAQGNY